MNKQVLELTDANFASEVKNAHGVALVDFWAPWCGPCRMMSPVIDQLAADYAGKVKVGKVNVDENRAVAAEFGIMSIPTIIIFKDGVKVDKVVGYQPKEILAQKLEQIL